MSVISSISPTACWTPRFRARPLVQARSWSSRTTRTPSAANGGMLLSSAMRISTSSGRPRPRQYNACRRSASWDWKTGITMLNLT